MASVQWGRKERADKNSTQEDALRPFWWPIADRRDTIAPFVRRMTWTRAYGKLRLYLAMFLCVLWDLSVFLSIHGGSVSFPVHLSCSKRICLYVFLRDLSPIYETREHRT
ncbi:hypothetical protein Bbelb_128820 [Branchiostoma belcheri]|nr:hypothetical protein Bbelb_128820 [Branchiostoma belcheri]